jgi:hypothetical protein
LTGVVSLVGTEKVGEEDKEGDRTGLNGEVVGGKDRMDEASDEDRSEV